jgi:tetratricopeptide (TPR) repeat protein
MSDSLQNAIAAHQNGRIREAEATYRVILDDNPDNAEALALLGALCLQRGDLDEALRLIVRSLEINPAQPVAHNNRGVVLQQLGKFDKAVESFDRAISLGADTPEIYYNRAAAQQALERYTEALADYDRALARRADYPFAYNNRGNVLRALGRGHEALKSYDQAIALKPDFADAHNNRGNVLRRLKHPEEALAAYARALEFRPDFAAAHYNRGVAMQDLNRPGEAIAAFDSAIALHPDYADAQWSKGTIKLLQGEFKHGWRLYEWRWKRPDYLAPRADFAQPLWHGEPIEGKTVLLRAEQGYGDTIQFCRYAKLVAARGANVILQVQQPLRSLLSSLDGIQRVLAQGEGVPPFDYHCPLLSLPLVFGTDLDSIPADIPYLKPPADRLAHWQAALGESKKPRIGIAWAGSRKHLNDYHRSVVLLNLVPIFGADAEFFSLQKDLHPADKVLLAGLPQIANIGENFADFADAAAAIAQFDIIISVDTVIAHLAGALGKPVWIMLPFAPEWRWLQKRSDSPWYPTARLFRQPKFNDWPGAIEAVRAALAGVPVKGA